MVTVMACVQAKPHFANDVKQACLALVAPSRVEAGCITYELYGAAGDPNLFIFFERRERREDIDRHLESGHCVEFDERTTDMLDGPEEIIFCEPITV
jgi:quinol monooxygenase YgiN